MTEHTCDAGDLGCGEGLAAWFRTRLREIPPGDILHAIVRDPAAREEIPALARLMGHSVTSIEVVEDRFVITLETSK